MVVQNGRTVLLCTAVVLVFILAPLTVPRSAWAAYDAFLNIEGIQGESRDPRHENDIEIMTWSFGTNVPIVPISKSQGNAEEKAVERDFRFTMKVNRASPMLFLACAERRIINKVTLFVRSSGLGRGQEYLVVTLGNVTVSSYQTTGNTKGPDDRPIDDVSLNFGEIVIVYNRIKPNGTLEASPAVKHNFEKTAGK